MTYPFIKALNRQTVDYTPLWIMRQAGRYLPEYRATRERAGNFMTLCQTPELACEVTMQPLARFDLDAAIIFSDILTIPDAMGLGLDFVSGKGPVFANPVRDPQAIEQLRAPDVKEQLDYVTDAVKLVKRELNGNKPLIGFSGSPWTLACYMVEGGSSKDFHHIKKLLYSAPDTLQQLLSVLTGSVTEYLQAQIKAGADAVMVFDSWGGILPTHLYEHFSLFSMKTILDQLAQETPTILFTKGGGQWLEKMAGTGASALGLDWTTDIGQARERVGNQVALQGNLDPAALLGTPDQLKQETERVLKSFGPHPGHVFNLGHGITPDINPDQVKRLVDWVHGYRTQ